MQIAYGLCFWFSKYYGKPCLMVLWITISIVWFCDSAWWKITRGLRSSKWQLLVDNYSCSALAFLGGKPSVDLTWGKLPTSAVLEGDLTCSKGIYWGFCPVMMLVATELVSNLFIIRVSVCTVLVFRTLKSQDLGM